MKLVSLAVMSIFSVIGSVMANNGDEPSLRGASTSDLFEQQVAKATVHEQYCKKKDEACNARVRMVQCCLPLHCNSITSTCKP